MSKYLLFFRFTDLFRSSRYYSSIVISINFYYVECGDGRQPIVTQFLNSEVQNTCSTPGFHADMAEPCYYICFRINTNLCLFFLFRAKTTLLALWIFTSNISPHFAEFEGDQIKDHRCKVDTNYPASRVA